MSKFQAEQEVLSEVLSRRAQDVLALFDDELSEVRFPDVDAEILAALLQHVQEAHHEVEQAERSLAAARARRAGHAEALESVVQRALAYARVFSEGDATLHERVLGIDREQTPAASPALNGKRGRPKKRAVAESDLFADETSNVDALARAGGDSGDAMQLQPTLM